MTSAVLCLFLLSAVPSTTRSTAVLFDRAANSLRAGDLAAAEQGFLEVLKVQPASIPALGNLGVTYSRMERFTDAIRVLRRALKLSPREPGLLLNLAIAHVKKGDYEAAKPLLTALPRNAQTRQLLATCELFTGRPREALALLEGLPRTPELLFLSGTAYLRLSQPDAAQGMFRELLSVAPPAQVHLLLGRAYAESTLFDDALPELRKAVELDPASVPARLELAKTLISMRDNDGAERELRTILAAVPAQPDASYYLGALLVHKGEDDAALPLLEASRSARPDAWGAYYYLGRAWMQKEQPARAVAVLETAAKLNPGQRAVWFQLARAYQTLGQTEKAQAARTRYSRISEQALEREGQTIPPNR